MGNQLEVLVNESGLEKSKAQILLDNFSDYFEIADEWERKAKTIKVTDASQEADMKIARVGRLALREKRILLEKKRKELKEQSLREGKAIDGIANALKAVIVPIEEYLDRQERFVQIKEEEKKELLRLEAEKRIEEERIAKEKEEAKERERIFKENERLRKEAEERDRLAKVEEEKRKKEEAERRAKELADQRAREEKERKEREAHQAELRRQQEESRRKQEEIEKRAEEERQKHEEERRKAQEEKERLEEELKNKVQCPYCHKHFQLQKDKK